MVLGRNDYLVTIVIEKRERGLCNRKKENVAYATEKKENVVLYFWDLDVIIDYITDS